MYKSEFNWQLDTGICTFNNMWGGFRMLDIIFAGTLVITFVVFALFAKWCGKQIESNQ